MKFRTLVRKEDNNHQAVWLLANILEAVDRGHVKCEVPLTGLYN